MKRLLLIITVMILIIYTGSEHESIPAAADKKPGHAQDYGNDYCGITSVRVMTFNIHRGINKDNKLDLDGIVEVIKNSGAEIIALQEVERFSARTGFKDQIGYIADKLSMEYAYGKSINILNGQYGNAILSKYPIESHETNNLPSKGENRILLKARLKVYGKSISVYSTHLGLEQSERTGQINAILKAAAADENVILAGDFNTIADKLQQITKLFSDSAEYGKSEDKPTFASRNLSKRIDYIFISKAFKVKGYDVLASDASDHYAVTSIIELSN